jgi:uncharacterized protein involved in exopolysaccharide biosynthesis
LSAVRATLRRRWRLTMIAFALPLALAAGLVAFLPGVYLGRAVVMVEPRAPGGTGEDTEVRLSQLTEENLGRTHMLALAKQLGQNGVAGDEPAAVALRRDITVESQKVDTAGKASSIAITVSVRGRDPERAASAANAVAQYYVDAEQEHLRVQAEAIGKQVDELRARFAAEQDRVADYQQHHLRELPEAVGVHLASVEGLTAQLEMVDFNRNRALERTHNVVRRPTFGSAGTADDADPDPEVSRLKQALRDMRARYTDEHPDVLRVRRELEAVEKQRAAGGPPPSLLAVPGKHPALEMQDAEADVRAATRAEEGLKGQIAGAMQIAFNAPRRGQELAALLPR